MFVHRDIKPENFCIGQGKKSNILHIIDFGLSKRYLCPSTGKHVPFIASKHMTGTVRWLSADASEGTHGRKDDLISVGYLLAFLWRGGTLPWDEIDVPLEPEIDDKDPAAY